MSKGIHIEVEGRLPSGLGLSKAEVRSAAAFFAGRSRARMGNPVWHEVVVHLVDDETSDSIHRAIMGISGATDVVTQAYDAIPPEPAGLLGEIFVNADQARRAAPKRSGWSVAKELLLYVAHGMDHLSGADDHSERGYLTMRRREMAWIRAFCRN